MFIRYYHFVGVFFVEDIKDDFSSENQTENNMEELQRRLNYLEKENKKLKKEKQ